MSIDDFLKQFVEGYLFGDLESMSKVSVPAGQSFGGVGYPMVATVLAGIELLGQLLMPNTDSFNPNSGNDYFLNYWDNYFSKQYVEYTGLGRLFRQLMRNGIAHTFVAKPGIFVEKGTNRQMSIDTTKQEIYIDCNVFFKEFENSYLKLVQPLIDGTAASSLTTKANIQIRLDNLGIVYTADSTRLFSALPVLHPTTNDTSHRAQVPVSPMFASLGARASGASLPLTPKGSSMGAAVPTTSATSSVNAATATIPSSITVPYTTISGTLPPKKNT
ncbi:MAG TPA: hypothetical protein VMR41_02025 [Patescibacteria group bacterium]|nr:hypothetical protein [Patescibacteria group bacterium]